MMLHADSFPGPRAFARHCLRQGFAWQPQTGLMFKHGFGECIVFREACWQIEIVCMPPGLAVPSHRHLRVSSADLRLAAFDSLAVVGGHAYSNEQRGSLAANLLLIPRGVWHEGSSGTSGAMFLSFQQWEGEPGYLGEDWEAA